MSALSTGDIDRIRSKAASLVEDYHLPGMSVGVVSGEELAYAEGFGFADIESGRVHHPGLRQRIGSITKTMVGLCAMALVDEGKLSLDERLVDKLPDINFTGFAETVLVRHLMTHTNGIGEAPRMEHYLDAHAELWSESAEPEPIARTYAEGIDVEVAADTKWAYANHAFALLGEIISRIEGERIEQVLRRRVYGPLDMADTDCYDQVHPGLTTGYHRAPLADDLDAMEILGTTPPDESPVDGRNIRGKYVYVGPRAAGAVQSTIYDMAKYASALLRESGDIVSPETFELMTSPHWCLDERLLSQGLTFMREEKFGLRSFGHGGGVSGGWNTHIDIFPTEDLAVLTHLNISFDKSEEIYSKLIQAVFDAPDPDVPRARAAPEITKAAVGVYEPPPGFLTSYRVIKGAGRLQIVERDGELELRARRGPWREGVRMVSSDPDDPKYFVLDTGSPEPTRLLLVSDESGGITGIQMGRMSFVRNSDLRPWA